MSQIELFGFRRDGTAELVSTFSNAWRFFMAVWDYMEQKHLPPYIPDYIKCCNWYYEGMPREDLVIRNGFNPTRCKSLFDTESFSEIWQLAENPDIPMAERIALYTTFDECLVRTEFLPSVIEAFETLGSDIPNLSEQAAELERIISSDYIAVGWGSSLVSPEWDEKSDGLPYNCLSGNEHFWLDDDLLKNDIKREKANG